MNIGTALLELTNSSFIDTNASAYSISAGGGVGSSYHDASGNTNTSTATGVHTGNGVVTFTY